MAGTPARAPLAARFPAFGKAAGGYESFYLRAVDPDSPRSVWLRHTVHKTPGHPPVGSVWITLFDRDAPAPSAHKQSTPKPLAQHWLKVGGSHIGPEGVKGSAGNATYDLTFAGDAPPLRHLPREWMYERPLPRTKSESPYPFVTWSGTVTVGATRFELDAWPGMIGHNWGDQHAERWIWLHGLAFEDAPDAWLDVVIGRIKLGPVTTPWIANGVLCLDGTRHVLGGPGAVRSTTIKASPTRLDLELPGLMLSARSPQEQTVVWRYADPDGSEHHTANCSVASLDATFVPRGQPPRTLKSAHGGAYELGMREHDHGLAVLPYEDP